MMRRDWSSKTHARRRVLVCCFCVAVGATGCADSGGVPTTGEGLTSSPSASSASIGRNSDRLTEPVTYDDGALRLAPPEDSYVPKVTSADALSIFASTNLYADATSDKSPSVLLALMTSYEQSSTVDATTGVLLPSTSDKPVWFIKYSGVPDVTGAGGIAASSADISPHIVTHDVIALVDADNGELIEVQSAASDTSAAPPPTAIPSKGQDGTASSTPLN